jgi:hypothetical protein
MINLEGTFLNAQRMHLSTLSQVQTLNELFEELSSATASAFHGKRSLITRVKLVWPCGQHKEGKIRLLSIMGHARLINSVTRRLI